MILLPDLLLSRLERVLTGPRLYTPAVATCIDARGDHWVLIVRNATIYVLTSPYAPSAADLGRARELPLYAMVDAQAERVADAMAAYVERVEAIEEVRRTRPVLELVVGGESEA